MTSILEQGRPGVLLVGVGLGSSRYEECDLDELALLAESAGYQPVGRVAVQRKVLDAAYYIGSGKVDEIQALANTLGATEILFDQALSPAQQRNLEKRIGLPVNDRTYLILDIFAQRARSHEGKLQVELARLQYLSTRLVRMWTHLERQQGGQGVRGGPGETQIELDRRMIGQRIKALKTQLSKVKRQRDTQSRARKRNEVFRVSLVGYTNAGKSTLFNALVKAQAYAADQLFATLDTTVRSLYLKEAETSISLSDTVGFIRDLPHTLVDAFEATLQEAAQADLLLHVIDASSEQYGEQITQVQSVLEEIGAKDIPQVMVFNKIDQLPDTAQPRVLNDWYEVSGKWYPRIFLSAQQGNGLEDLRELLAKIMTQGYETLSEVPCKDKVNKSLENESNEVKAGESLMSVEDEDTDTEDSNKV